jgi:hypothetical protein
MDFKIGDDVYYLGYSSFKKTIGRCPGCGGSGLIKGLIPKYPNLICTCPECHATGEVEKILNGYYIKGLNVIVDMGNDNVIVSSRSMMNDIERYVLTHDGASLRDGFIKTSNKYTWEKVNKSEVFLDRDSAIEEIIKRKGILVGG